MRVASLPMYGERELRPATERWWKGLAAHLRGAGVEDVPEALTWPEDVYEHWRSPDLLFSQTCGHPLINLVAGDVRPVATPQYGVPGCDGPRYRSFILVRDGLEAAGVESLRGARLAVNGDDSYSGYHVWRKVLPGGAAPDAYFGDISVTGAHRDSIRWVKDGRADLCAVDCVSYALLGDRVPDEVAGLRVLAQTPPAPALPFVTGAGTPPEDLARLREGLSTALADEDLADVRDALHLVDFTVLPVEDYMRVFANPLSVGAGNLPQTS